jgi:CheY-like chemotaxis protein
VRAGEPFALGLIDAHMPDTDGFMLAERIQQLPQLAGLTLIMLTSGGQPGDVGRCRKLGITSYLTKPVKQNELWKTIATALGGEREALSPAQGPTDRSAAAPSARSLRILLAEDNPVNQRLALALLEKRGHRVTVAGDGVQALAALPKQRFDLVLMDLQMPEMDGLDATARIREKEKGTGGHIPIIAMTAYAMKGDKERCLAAGMDGYISKPVRPAELYQILDRLGSAEPPATPLPAPAPDPALDWEAALDYLGGNRDLLRELIGLFLEEYPGWLEQVRQAIANGNANDLKRAAHNLKGSMAHFGAKPAFEAARKLEMMARNGILSGAAEACAELEKELERLHPALAAFTGAEAPSQPS